MNRIIIKIKLLAISFFIAGSILAQDKLTKVSQTFKVDKEVTIDLNTSYTNIVFDTWNKSTVEIEAYIEGDNLNQDELQEALKSWDLDVDGSASDISIKSSGKNRNVWVYNTHGEEHVLEDVLKELKFELADLPNLDLQIVIPNLPEMPEMPELPELPKGVSKIHFDFDAYEADSDTYLEEYTKQFESTFGEDYAKKMEAWGEKFGKEWGEKYGKQMEAWAEEFEEKFNSEDYAKKMEAWSEKFGEEWGEKYTEHIEAWGKRFAERMEREADHIEAQVERKQAQAQRMQEHEKHIEKQYEVRAKEREKLAEKRRVSVEALMHNNANAKVKKTIKIKMPKDAKLKVNVRHGELNFVSNIDNLKADLEHTTLIANSINGGLTSINAAYSPVYITNWHLGELNLKYVKQAELNNVKNLVLNSNASNITINHLAGNALIDGHIGDLNILKIDDAFTNLNIIIQNSDAFIALPKVAHNLQYKGTYSTFNHPESKTDKKITSYSKTNLNSNKAIILNAKYSNVTMH